MEIVPPESSSTTSLAKKSDSTRTDSIISSSKRNQRILSIEETVIKHETNLEIARKTIKNLQAHLETVILSGSSSDDDISMDEEEDIQAEVAQMDSFFAHQHTFRTNVRKISYAYILNIFNRLVFISGQW